MPEKLEDAVLNVERRKIEKEEGQKAQRAMQALDVSSSGTPSARQRTSTSSCVQLCTRVPVACNIWQVMGAGPSNLLTG